MIEIFEEDNVNVAGSIRVKATNGRSFLVVGGCCFLLREKKEFPQHAETISESP